MAVDLTELDEFFTASREVRRPFEPQWFLNIAYHDGRQWVAFDGRHLFEPELEPWRAKLVDNRIRGLVRKDIARTTKQRPMWVGVPANADDDEIDAARFRERLFESDWKYLSMVPKRRAAQKWAKITGGGFLKLTWDSSCGPGKEVYVGEDGKSVKDPDGRPITKDRVEQSGLQELVQGASAKTVQMGDPRVDVRSPFEMFPDPLAGEEGLSTCRHIGEEAVHDPEHLKARYDVTLEPDSAMTSSPLQSMFGGAASGKKRGVKVREYWCLPCSDYRDGLHVVYIPESQEVLLEEDMPYPWLPYVMFRGEPKPGSFWCTGIDDYISPQTELNKSLSQIAENGERIGNPPFLKPTSADFEWQGLPGEEIEYQDTGSPNAKPGFMDVPELPQYVQNRPAAAENSLREISHQHEVTSGNVPAGVTAASAINLLQEADDTVLGPDIEDMEAALTEAGRRMLWLRWRYCSDERMLRIAGEDGAWDLQAFRGQMLKNGGDNDEVQAGSSLPKSKAARQAAIAQMLTLFIQNSIPVDERRLRRTLRDMDVGGLDNMLADLGRDERAVNEENRRMLSGELTEAPPINAYDNDPIHVAGHEDMQKSPRYSELAKTAVGQRKQQLIDEHVGLHRQRIADKELAAINAQNGGPPGQNGGPPGSVATQQGVAATPPAPPPGVAALQGAQASAAS